MSSFKIGANQPNLLTLSPLQGGRTVSAAVSVAANEVVVELMNGSFAILLFLTRKDAKNDEINSHRGQSKGPSTSTIQSTI
jgi:hypothetical protein